VRLWGGAGAFEAHAFVERQGKAHRGHGVAYDFPVTSGAGLGHEPLEERAAQTSAAKGRTQIESLAFGAVLVDAAQGDATGGLDADGGERETAAGRRIGAGKAREFIAEVLEAWREAEGVPVLVRSMRTAARDSGVSTSWICHVADTRSDLVSILRTTLRLAALEGWLRGGEFRFHVK